MPFVYAPDHSGGRLRYDMDHILQDNNYRFHRFNRINGGLNPEYIKFVEDCMLVLLLFCVLVTLLVVHRASCYR